MPCITLLLWKCYEICFSTCTAEHLNLDILFWRLLIDNYTILIAHCFVTAGAFRLFEPYLMSAVLCPCRFGLLDLRFSWGSPRPRSTSAGLMEVPCAPSVSVTGKRKLMLSKATDSLVNGNRQNCFQYVYNCCLSFSGSSVLSWLRSRRLLSRCSRRRHRARSRSKMCICTATIKNDKSISCFFLLSTKGRLSRMKT